MITDRVNHAHGLLAPFMPISEFAASVLKPEAFGFDHKSQFYEPIQFGVHVTGRANNSRGCMRIAVPVHENESNWLPLMKSRFARMINKPELIKQKLEFRTVDGRALDQFSIDELPHVGRLHAYANGTKLILPSMPNVAIEYSSKKVDSLQSWINTMSDRLPDFMGDQLAGLDGPGIDNKMRPNGAFQASVQKFIMSSVDNWTEFVRIHNVNSPLSMNKDVALGVASNIASEVRNQMHGLLKSAQKAVLKHLVSMESKRIKERLGESDSEQHETLFSNTNDAVDAAHDHGSDLFCRLGDDLVASPLFQHTFMDNLYSRPLPVNGCRWDTEPAHASGGGGGGGGGYSRKNDYRFDETSAKTKSNVFVANLIHNQLLVKKLLTKDQIRNILLSNLKNITSSITMISFEVKNDSEKKHADILMIVARLQKVAISTSQKNFKQFVEELSELIYQKRAQYIKQPSERSEFELLVMGKYPIIKRYLEANDLWKFNDKEMIGKRDLIELLEKSYNDNDRIDVIDDHIENFISKNKTNWEKIRNYWYQAKKLKAWWQGGEMPEDADKLYYLSFVASYMYGIDLSKGPGVVELWNEIHKSKNMFFEAKKQWTNMVTDSRKWEKEKLALAKKADEAEKSSLDKISKLRLREKKEKAASAVLEASTVYGDDDDDEEKSMRAESAKLLSSTNDDEDNSGSDFIVPDEAPPPPPGRDEEAAESGPAEESRPVQKDPTVEWKGKVSKTVAELLSDNYKTINITDLAVIRKRKNFEELLNNADVVSRISTSALFKIAELLNATGYGPDTERVDLIEIISPLWKALPAVKSDINNHHPFNALIHATLEPALGQYPTYYKTLHTKEDMSASAPFSGSVEETYKTYHALLGVPLNVQPGVFINCHGSPQMHRKDKKKNHNYPTYRYENNEAPLIEAPVMEMPELIPIARERSPVRGAGAVPKLIPIDGRVRRSRSRSRRRRSRSPKYEKMEAKLPELIPLASRATLPELVPIAKKLPPKEIKSHMDFPDVDDIF